jgi:hypothetical protein
MTDETDIISQQLLRMSHKDCALHHNCAMLYDAIHRIQYDTYIV